MNSNKDIEERLNNAVTNATPDVLDEILSKCDEVKQSERKGVVIDMKKPTNKNKWIQKVSLIAAAFAVIAIGGFSFNHVYNNSSKVASVVDLDVNPSIEIKVNKAEKIIEVDPLNKDAKIIVDGMELKGVKLDVAMNAIIGSMLKNGYITDLQNAILVTVDNKNDKKSQEMQQKLAAEIEKILKSNSIDGCVVSQTSKGLDPELVKLAEANQISVGKAKLINSIISQDGKYKFEDLAKLSIHELQLIIQSKDIKLGNTTSTGKANQKAYIGEEAAKQIALKQYGQGNAEKVKASLDSEKGKMIYEVEIEVGDTEYEYDIDAITGAVLKVTVDKDDPAEDQDNDAEEPDDLDDEDDDKAVNGTTKPDNNDDSDDDPDDDDTDDNSDDSDDTDDDNGKGPQNQNQAGNHARV